MVLSGIAKATTPPITTDDPVAWFIYMSVCLSLCLHVCHTRATTNRLDFGGDPDQEPDPERISKVSDIFVIFILQHWIG